VDSSGLKDSQVTIEGLAEFPRQAELTAAGGKKGAGTAPKSQKIRILKPNLDAHP
jgi:hypothetical protein